MPGHCSNLHLTHMWPLQEMQERKKIKKKERKKKKKPESEADPDPELDAVRADTSEAEPGEPGESSDEAALQAPSPQPSAEHVGLDAQEAADAAAAAGPALAAAAATATADGEWLCVICFMAWLCSHCQQTQTLF